MKYTPEQLYSLYHQRIMLYTKNIIPRAIKNFDKIKQKPEWDYFEKFAKLVNSNNGQLDPKLYIDSLIDFNDGYFSFKLLSHPKGIKIYKTYIKVQNNTYDKEKIFKSVTDSLRFVAKYMKDNNIDDFYQYLNQDSYLLPTIAKHFNSGSISKQFLVLVPDILLIIDQFPIDIKRCYFDQFSNEFDSIKSLLMTYPKLKKVSDNIETIIEKLIEKC